MVCFKSVLESVMTQSRSIFPSSRILSHVNFGIKEDHSMENLSLFSLLLVSEPQPSFLTQSLFQEACCLNIPCHVYFLFAFIASFLNRKYVYSTCRVMTNRISVNNICTIYSSFLSSLMDFHSTNMVWTALPESDCWKRLLKFVLLNYNYTVQRPS